MPDGQTGLGKERAVTHECPSPAGAARASVGQPPGPRRFFRGAPLPPSASAPACSLSDQGDCLDLQKLSVHPSASPLHQQHRAARARGQRFLSSLSPVPPEQTFRSDRRGGRGRGPQHSDATLLFLLFLIKS